MKRHHISFAANRGTPDSDHGSSSRRSGSSAMSSLERIHTSHSIEALTQTMSLPVEMSSDQATETTVLLSAPYETLSRGYSDPATFSPQARQPTRQNSVASILRTRKSLGREQTRTWDIPSPVFTRSGLRTPRLNHSLVLGTAVDERLWYDQFTSTDWVHDSIADGYRALELQKRKGIRGRLWLLFDAAQGWILVAIIGFMTAAVAYVVDVTEASIFDLKRGYCRTAWYHSQRVCCAGHQRCDDWRTWSEVLHPSTPDAIYGDYFAFILGGLVFALLACFLTLASKTVIPSHVASTFDENLGAEQRQIIPEHDIKSPLEGPVPDPQPVMTYYSAAGSGVAEVKVILSGFVLHGYLGVKTLLLKCPALVFSVASGMSLGKEGPYVHIATCIGNIACRVFSKYNLNDGKRREVLSAAAASGVAVAFGSPLGGVLFSLEEVSYYFPPKTLFRTFFCCIAAALSLKFLNPYDTRKIVPFEVRYSTDWNYFELFNFVLLGVMGGLAGAGFIKASRFWAKSFRSRKIIKAYPWLEVLLVALVTGVISFWNKHSNIPVTELLFQLTSPCQSDSHTGLCPSAKDDIPRIIGGLSITFVIKAVLTTVTFGIKVPAGIYVPSMVCGGLMGRIVGHIVQYLVLKSPESVLFRECAASGNMEDCVTPGVYGLVAAGATMCGVTRLSVTLAVILFELTGSLDHVLPFAIGILAAKWTADYVEPSSIYDLLIDMNSYPFMDNRRTPLFDGELSDITPRYRGDKIIDISISPHVRASELRTKVRALHTAGELDGGLAIVRDKALVGFIPTPDLEFALDRLGVSELETLCLMSNADQLGHDHHHRRWFAVLEDDTSVESESISVADEDEQSVPEADFTAFIDPAPIALEIHSPMNLVYQCFSKLGLKCICVVEAGEFRGVVHKKAFVKYVKTCEQKVD